MSHHTLGPYIRGFFTNWRESDLPAGKKIAKTMKNRVRSAVRGGCCGHHGEPGC
jgi:hypothetical protein